MVKRIVFLSVSFFIITNVFAQTSADTLVASQYYKKADSLLIDKKHEESIEFFNKALPEYKKAKVWGKVASCYNKISENQWRIMKLEKSLQNSKKALVVSNQYFTKDNRQKANAFDNMANYYLRIGSYNKSLLNFKKAKKILLTLIPENNNQVVGIYKNIARIYSILGDNTKSLYYLDKCLKIYKKKFGESHVRVGTVYSNIGNVYTEIGENDTALEYYEKALSALPQTQEKYERFLSGIYNNMGVLNGNMGRYETSIDYHKKALELKIKIFGKNNFVIAKSYSGMGNVYGLMGQYNLSLEYLKKALNIASEVNKRNSIPEISGFYNNISATYIKVKNYNEALNYIKKAIETHQLYHKKDHISFVVLYTNMGITLNQLKRYDEAITYFEKTLKIYKINPGLTLPDEGYSYYNLGNTYKLNKELELAIENYKNAIKVYSKLYTNKSHEVAKCYNEIGNVYSIKGDYTRAIEYYQKSLISNNRHFDSKSIYNNPDLESDFNSNIQINSLFNKANVLGELYHKNKNVKFMKTALSTYSYLDSIIDKNRYNILNYEDKMQFSELASDIYEKAIIAEGLMAKEETQKMHLEKAYYYLEKKKANTLKELLLKIKIKNNFKIPSSIITLDDQIKLDQSYYKSKITELTSISDSLDTLKISKYKDKLFSVNRRSDSLKSIMRQFYKSYFDLKYNNLYNEIEYIQSNLKTDNTILQYFMSKERLYVFVIANNTFKMIDLGSVKKIEKNLSFLKTAIISKNILDYKNIAFKLCEQLIQPISGFIETKQLIIIPDGALWNLNFELLLTQKNETSDARSLPYLLRDYAISYANSANLLFNQIGNSHQTLEIKKECLAFSFSDTTNLAASTTISLATLRDAEDDLPGTREEIRAISKIINGKYYYGNQAIESNFKKNANEYSILHLALHGEVDNEKPENSKLYFTKSKDTLEDNLLYAHELFALDIPAELTVLSACNTGTGKIANGEGIMSLGTAFQYAGTRSLLLSSWEVSDRSAPKLIEKFYTNLADGMNKSKALQKAKLDFLKTADLYHIAPFYWGNYYLLGNSEAIKMDKPIEYTYWVILSGIILIFSLLVFLYRKKKKQV
ncbi:CHAT domain-containing protein [Aquimarina algiphila]|uniref:CHAT domain-containing protein n=1 Tax=Aquimarina algiphila TaxID=2047982 RepID=UPI00248F7E93|nr:CHAT domain-containing tetratricopeptide repeat protein [Aquimarina algiphila]